MREWLVIEKTVGRSVFAPDGARDCKGYIPRDVVEGELGIRIEPDGRHTWFNNVQSALMRAHPEWRDTEPPGHDPRTERQDNTEKGQYCSLFQGPTP